MHLGLKAFMHLGIGYAYSCPEVRTLKPSCPEKKDSQFEQQSVLMGILQFSTLKLDHLLNSAST